MPTALFAVLITTKCEHRPEHTLEFNRSQWLSFSSSAALGVISSALHFSGKRVNYTNYAFTKNAITVTK